MTSFKGLPQASGRARLGAAAVALLALGAAGGAGAVSLTRPSVEMAPTVATPIAKLPASTGVVTVKGKIVEVFGNRFVIQDQTGRTMIDGGPRSDTRPAVGQVIGVQGRYDEGSLHASYLIGPDGQVSVMGPPGGARAGPGGPAHSLHDGPPPPLPAGGPERDGPTPPPPGCDMPAPAAARTSPSAPANAQPSAQSAAPAA